MIRPKSAGSRFRWRMNRVVILNRLFRAVETPTQNAADVALRLSVTRPGLLPAHDYEIPSE